MSIGWQTPAALAGLLLLLIPIAMHLFARTPVIRVVVPSLRVVDPRAPRLRRRRYLRDRWLLAVRLVTIAAAVMAAAGPLLTTPARERSWTRRTARAIVVDGAVSGLAVDAAIASEQADVMAAERFVADPPDSGLARAVAWLSRQPPARREVVIIGDDASIPSVTAVAGVPAEVGIRMRVVAAESAPAEETRHWIGGDGADGAVHALRLATTAPGSATTTAVEPMPSIPVTLIAGPADRPQLEAVWAGVRAEGAFLRSAATWRTLEVTWVGAGVPMDAAVTRLTAVDRVALLPMARARPATATEAPPAAPWTRLAPDVVAARRGEAIVVAVTRDAEPAHAAVLLRGALVVAAAESDRPRRMRFSDAGAVAAIERPSQGIARGAERLETVRDGRWLWWLAILGLAVEQVLRRRRGAGSRPDAAGAIADGEGAS